MNNSYYVVEVRKTSTILSWLKALRDPRAIARIAVMIGRPSLRNPGDVRPVGEGPSEMRIDYGRGYRVYFEQRGPTIVILLCDGDKSSQGADIARAKLLAQEV